MAKNTAKKPNAAKRDDALTVPMKIFLIGCVAELYLLIVRRFFINGTLRQVIAWNDIVLPAFIWAGVALFVLGGVFWLQKKAPRLRGAGKALACVGVFLILVTELVLWHPSVLTPLLILIPVLILLGILWLLYDRECAVALTILGFSLLALWGYRRYASSIYVGAAYRAAVIVYLVLLAVLAILLKSGKLKKLLPPSADPLPVYLACALSAAALIAAFVSATAAFYAIWALALVVFALAVYYTVKQL